MATKKYGYNQYKPDGPAGMDIVDQELNRYSPAFDYLSGFVTRSNLKQVDDDRTGTAPTTPSPTTPTPTTPTPTTPTPTTPTPTTPTPTTPTPTTPTPTTPTPTTPTPTTPTPTTPTPTTPTPTTPTPTTPTPTTPTPTTPTPTTPTPTTPTPYSSEFATEQDAKDYINQYYQTTLGRDAKFGTTTDDTDASYWLKNFASGGDTKSSFESNVKLGDEYKNRLDTVNTYNEMSGRNPTEQELDAIVNPGGSLSSTGNTQGSQFLTDYATQISAGDNTAELDAAVTSADDITDADEKYKYENMSQGVKDIYSMGLNVGDTQAQTTQTTAGTTKTSTVDQAIKDAYQLLGRDPDKEGYDYWAKQLKADPTFDLSESFKLSPEYKLKNPT
jgi:hypothetical protein